MKTPLILKGDIKSKIRKGRANFSVAKNQLFFQFNNNLKNGEKINKIFLVE